MIASVTTYRVAEAAELLGVSDDTLRRWIEAGRRRAAQRRRAAPSSTAPTSPRLAKSLADHPDRERSRASAVSARNRLAGIVTDGQEGHRDGPGRDDLRPLPAGLADELARPPTSSASSPACCAIASVKSTNVVVERP